LLDSSGKVIASTGKPPEVYEIFPIAAFQRNGNSGSQTLFLKLLMKDSKTMAPREGLVPGGMFALIEGVSAYDGTGGAIGYSVFYYASLMYANPDIKLLSVNGIAPSNESIGFLKKSSYAQVSVYSGLLFDFYSSSVFPYVLLLRFLYIKTVQNTVLLVLFFSSMKITASSS